ncbi:dTDP-4-dehydrorhamnose reductase [Simiduia sp. 21SJ11W-1]|uniref:dTDP-4-dehydrorhamnose reductase n=1 Tax=Simiduia sp. 21SJ11W-1 TaxID=2909669 RepID=UPI00209EFA59|nr:dTDP-4-dehydrorhamnose reductase [Simiduia sp. 21SJ11W-1]UTA49535.1 dTDP-4-dehydrorhamnose reductase [Simiduia sp. 21SJ11W-1]
MKILLLGCNGQVGWELQRSLAPLGEIIAWGREELNFSDLTSVNEKLASLTPDLIVNAAAYTAVDQAETDIELARLVNSDAVRLLADRALELGIWLIHYSTDYVFDGQKKSAYEESDITSPQSIYGKTKRAGEVAIQSSGCKHLIFRTSWVYARRGGNFAKTMLKLASERDSLKVVSDQVGAPTSAELIADVTALCIVKIFQDQNAATSLSGVYHLAAKGEVSWYQYAQFVLEKAEECTVALKVNSAEVQAIATADYPVPAKRPANSKLSTQKLSEAFRLDMPDWQHHMQRFLSEHLSHYK